MTHPNAEIIRRGYEAFGEGDLDAVLSIFDDAIRFYVPGSGALGGVYRGRDEVVGFFAKISELSGGTFRMELHDVLANDEHVVVLVRVRAERGEKSFAGTEAHVWHVSGGKASDMWSLPTEQAASDEFWS